MGCILHFVSCYCQIITLGALPKVHQLSVKIKPTISFFECWMLSGLFDKLIHIREVGSCNKKLI